MASRTAIANKALRRLGSDEISDIDDTGSESARAIKSVFDQCLDEVVAAHPWNCALARSSLASDAAAPAWGYQRAFTLPADCLRVLALEDSHMIWKVEGRKIVTDEAAPLKIKFIKRITDTEQLAPWVADVLAAKIAWDVAFRLTPSAAREDAMAKRYTATLALGRSTDSAEGTPDPIEADELELSRL